MKRLICSFTALVFLISCKNYEQKKLGNVDKFDLNQIEHMPSDPNNYQLLSDVLFYPEMYALNRGVYYRGFFKIKKEAEYLRLVKYCETSSLIQGTHSDQRFIFICRNENMIFKKDTSMVDFYPVPNFTEEISDLGLNEDYLPDQYKLYVLAVKPGIFISQKYLLNINCLSEKWIHGISQGIAINEENRTAIFWVEIW